MEQLIKKSLKLTYSVVKPVIDMATDMVKQDRAYPKSTEALINGKNFQNKTGYFIWVDKRNFKVNVFQYKNNGWVLLKSFLCSIGKPSTPTPEGIFSIGIKGLFFGTEKGYKARYYTQYKDNYLFHSILYNLDGTIRDGRLGMAISDGCIRLSLFNAKWIFDNIPKNTGVYIT
ncbi:L,D-transpeptidase [Clostridium cellulovorans]|uniref:ErfK/YbiS/YcfS/YnhG family protein n=1 Tax=Clostridium cellulovorans (strain ATCC 35296 / DSM 3052 / OCM 3 / 743B) TaxID=573061 RepID=D9SMB4_CLOC7|nr:L,D-transpeptidase [Clostridium cellulovorans]ADL53770.1 ErfK/YbiS/YcfS/YnhG family protein [Clostridium cellulovorans 743B]